MQDSVKVWTYLEISRSILKKALHLQSRNTSQVNLTNPVQKGCQSDSYCKLFYKITI